MTQTDPKSFWDERILRWERDRYSNPIGATSLVERLASRSSNSLRFRIEVTPKLLTPYVGGKRIVDIGCGSGLNAERLLECGAASYIGLDISPSAIENAKKLAAERGTIDRTTFVVGTVRDLEQYAPDIVISLGLLDWLSDAELESLFREQKNADFLHAFAERRNSLSQLIHRWLAYGRSNGGYAPRYYSARELVHLAAQYHSGPFPYLRTDV